MSSNPFFRPPEPPVPPFLHFLPFGHGISVPPVPPFLHFLPLGHGISVGTVMAFAGPLGLVSNTEKKPKNQILLKISGWMVCDGRELKVVDYPELFDVLGYVYGGNGGDTFKIPDYGGYFLRGAPISDDAKLNKDPDVDYRTPPKGGSGGSERDAGSIQEDAIQEHIHKFKAVVDISSVAGGTETPAPIQGIADTHDTENPSEKDPKDNVRTSKETRPKNVYVHFIIKCR